MEHLLSPFINRFIRSGRAFALYRLPHRAPLTLMMDPEGAIPLSALQNLHERVGFVVSPFRWTDRCPLLLIRPDIYAVGEEAIYDILRHMLQAEENSTGQDNNTAKAASMPHFPTSNEAPLYRYKYSFERFMAQLQQGRCSKLVLSRKADIGREDECNLAASFFQALAAYPHAMVALFHTPATGTWLTCSPELFAEGSENDWRTLSLAGTMWPETHLPEQGAWSEKNRREQELVTTFFEERFAQLSVPYTKEACKTIAAGELLHLATYFSFHLSSPECIWPILSSLYPTPAICGTPQREAFDVICEQEGYERGYYSGLIGPKTMDKTSLYVNLRCMQATGGRLYLYAGGGLLPSSTLEKEWLETQKKMETIRRILL